MPIHDWTRVIAGTWHDFHFAWVAELRKALNRGLLPPGYYAQVDQVARPFGPDVLTLQGTEPAATNGAPGRSGTGGGVAVTVAPPRTAVTHSTELTEYTRRRRSLAVRHASGHEIVALIEIVSPGNKGSQYQFDTFVRKVTGALAQGIHVLVVDLFPPTPRDPRGIHAAIWADLVTDPPGGLATPDAPLILAGYQAEPDLTAFIEPTAVGRPLIDMPLFLTPDTYVNVPLEPTYQAAFEDVPEEYKRILA
jgi:hypothetical protein